MPDQWPDEIRKWAMLPLRLVVGYGFFAHGIAKLIRGPAGFAKLLVLLGVPFPGLTAWMVTLFEIVGGIGLIVGLLVPLLSIPLGISMLVALFTIHIHYGFSAVNTVGLSATGPRFGPPGYEISLLYIAALVALAMSSPGALSVESWWRSRRTRRDSISDEAPTIPDYRIIAARPDDLPSLPGIELAASRMLAAWLEEEALAETTDVMQLEQAGREGRLWVALDHDAPVGFAYVELLEPTFAHLEEIDVHPEHGHRGLGRRLLTTVCAWAAGRGYRGVTLTTFRDPPWNMPFYASAGFQVVPPADLRPALAAVFHREAVRGLDPARRVVMERRNPADAT